MGDDSFESALVQPPEWYDAHDVDLRLGTRVTAVDPVARTVTAGGATQGYDKLLLATGARPRHLAMADDSGAPVAYLRTVEDSDLIRSRLRVGRRLVIIGGGWIGLEVAAAARRAGAHVTILEALDLPLVRVLGPEVARTFAALHQAHGVDLRVNTEVSSHRRPTADVAIVTLADGSSIEADLLVVGIGVTPDTALAEAAGLTHRQRHRRRRPAAHAPRPTSSRPATSPTPTTRCLAATCASSTGTTPSARAWSPRRTCWARRCPTTGCPTSSPTSTTSAWSTSATSGRTATTTWSSGARPTKGTFTAFWLREGRVLAGMHANDWDAMDSIRQIVGGQRVVVGPGRRIRVPGPDRSEPRLRPAGARTTSPDHQP